MEQVPMLFTTFAQQFIDIFWIRLQKLKPYFFYVGINVFITFLQQIIASLMPLT